MAMFTSGVVNIRANIEKVWRIVKNLEDYNKISHGAVTIHCEGKTSPGDKIILELYKEKFIGKLIPKSKEIISTVDENNKILGWVRKVPNGSYTNRYQALEKISDHLTRSYIILQIPGSFGKVIQFIFGKIINSALKELNTGIKNEAENLNTQ